MNLKISVVIPLYNKERTIVQTIESVINQTFTDFEIVVVNDGSTDKSASLVAGLDDPRVRLINQENGGVSKARNTGIKEAKGKYIAFLDGDDCWMPNHLEEIVSLISDYGNVCSVFTTNFIRKFNDGDSFPNRSDLKRGIIENYFRACLKSVVINASCVVIKKDALSKIGGFSESYTHGEDIDLWNRLARIYKVAYTPEVTSVYNITGEGSVLTMNYSRESARHALVGVSLNPYDLYLSLRRYTYYCIKRAIKYNPRVRKPKH